MKYIILLLVLSASVAHSTDLFSADDIKEAYIRGYRAALGDVYSACKDDQAFILGGEGGEEKEFICIEKLGGQHT